MNKLCIKFQSQSKSTKIDTFRQEKFICHSPGDKERDASTENREIQWNKKNTLKKKKLQWEINEEKYNVWKKKRNTMKKKKKKYNVWKKEKYNNKKKKYNGEKYNV